MCVFVGVEVGAGLIMANFVFQEKKRKGRERQNSHNFVTMWISGAVESRIL